MIVKTSPIVCLQLYPKAMVCIASPVCSSARVSPLLCPGPRVTIWSPMSLSSPAQPCPAHSPAGPTAQPGHRLADIYIYNHNYSSDLNISISSISPAFSSFIPAPACYSSIIIYSKPLPCLVELQTKVREDFTITFKTLC